MYRILFIEDDVATRQAADGVLCSLGHDVVAVEAADAVHLLDRESFDVVIAGVEPPARDPIAITTEPVHVPQSLLYLARPFTMDDVVTAVADLRDRLAVEDELCRARQTLTEPSTWTIVGRSLAMRRVLDRVAAVSDSEAPVLLTGESGTGKELLARTIHTRSSRHESRSCAINCAAFPETLLEAELFGYERGAFTGALQKRAGRFTAADGGTLFLDEVNGLSLTAQAKLLRVLQDGTFQPIGTNSTLSVDVRLVSATNRNLKALVAEGKFREDLYYRINVLDIEVPPLRDRRGDLPLLAQHFLGKYARYGMAAASVTPRAWAALSQHGFPGNVRELEHAIQHALVLSRGGEIDVDHLPRDLQPYAVEGGPPGESEVRALADAVREFEREYVLRTLQVAGGNKTRAAQLLGISRKNLWHKLTRMVVALGPEDTERAG